MLSWLRRTLGWFERRWIRDPDERERHGELVRQRLVRQRLVRNQHDRGEGDNPEPPEARG